jgi:ABC-type dipeptide/oligopeptide/nickel transport system permease component
VTAARQSLTVASFWWLRPVFMTAANLVLFAIAAFFLSKLIPGDPLTVMSGGRLNGAELEAARASLGLDLPWYEQLWVFLTDLARVDLGTSIATGREISDDLATRLPATLELVFVGLLCTIIVSVLLSFYTVTHRGSLAGRFLSLYARTAGALPEFVIGIAFLFVFYALLGWAPAPTGRIDPFLATPEEITGFPMLDALLAGDSAALGSYAEHLVLPVIVMVCAHSALIMKMLLISLEEAINEPSTKFRVASGAGNTDVLLSVCRRAAPSAVTTIGMIFGMLLGGALVLESLFGLGGLGQFAVDAVNTSDVFALRSFLVLVAAICLAVYLIVDFAVMSLDPRRRPGMKGKA